MSIKSQADFWLKNVCDFQMTNHDFSDEVIEGFTEFTYLMRDIYADYTSFETSTKDRIMTKIGITEDDLENYHNLTETVDCLYKMTALGELRTEGENVNLKIDKAVFKTKFRKSVSFVFSILEKYCFYFVFYKNEKEVKDYKTCNSFCLYYENSNKLIPAMKLLADTLAGQSLKNDLSNGLAFFIADYESIFNQTPATPQKQCITNLLGDYAMLWSDFIDMADHLGLTVELKINPYVFPNWTAKISKKKKTVCTFYINCDKLFIRLPISFDVAKELVLTRSMLPDSINNCISNWHCVNCGKCQNQSNIEMVEDVPLCTLKYSNFCTEDSRILSFTITKEDELKVVKDIISKIT